MTRRCRTCGKPTSGRAHCSRLCYLKATPPTPVRVFTWKSGVSLRRLSRKTGMGIATLERVAAGHPIGGSAWKRAVALSRAIAEEGGTITPEELLKGAEDADHEQ